MKKFSFKKSIFYTLGLSPILVILTSTIVYAADIHLEIEEDPEEVRIEKTEEFINRSK